MKRREILKKLRRAGFHFEEGANHTHVVNPQGARVSRIGRHVEIEDDRVRDIEKQTGVKLLP